jgi:large subunit ribosomal protein L4
MEQPKTREFEAILERLDVPHTALVLLAERNDAVEKSVRNLPSVKTLRASYLNIRDLLGYDTVLIPMDSLDVIVSILG